MDVSWGRVKEGISDRSVYLLQCFNVFYSLVCSSGIVKAWLGLDGHSLYGWHLSI